MIVHAGSVWGPRECWGRRQVWVVHDLAPNIELGRYGSRRCLQYPQPHPVSRTTRQVAVLYNSLRCRAIALGTLACLQILNDLCRSRNFFCRSHGPCAHDICSLSHEELKTFHAFICNVSVG